jgi:hypothetical protein
MKFSIVSGQRTAVAVTNEGRLISVEKDMVARYPSPFRSNAAFTRGFFESSALLPANSIWAMLDGYSFSELRSDGAIARRIETGLDLNSLICTAVSDFEFVSFLSMNLEDIMIQKVDIRGNGSVAKVAETAVHWQAICDGEPMCLYMGLDSERFTFCYVTLDGRCSVFWNGNWIVKNALISVNSIDSIFVRRLFVVHRNVLFVVGSFLYIFNIDNKSFSNVMLPTDRSEVFADGKVCCFSDTGTMLKSITGQFGNL